MRLDEQLANELLDFAEERGQALRQSNEHRKQDEEVVIWFISRRDRTPSRDCLTPRMEARQIIDALDAARAARQ